ncbi:Carboxylesterase NlhH [Rosistilla carotiformis]|uniref:Carboxylesterase NlhH n=1 Tax=Rosistilla carotiformis TaxID=2528017 RepID=A0A518JUI4_9BACT|nr:alpha/beta hydrolase [Rosistilla carotiformis]QDV69209.1 Carboxylesterase NlhH [Rosistilla carotiformis]
MNRFPNTLRLVLSLSLWTQVAAAEEPTLPTLSRYSVRFDQPYHVTGETTLLADVYQPAELTDRCPIVLVIHGGAWMSGDKALPGTYARMFAENGIAAVSINYRLAPTDKFPAQLDDVRKALAWIHDQAAANRWDLQRLGMFGYSAGAHLSCMIAMLADESAETVAKTTQLSADDPLWRKQPRPIAVAAGGTPTDFRDLPPDNTMLAYFFGGTRRQRPDAYEFGSPAVLASAGDPPTLFYHGTRDLLVPIAGAEALFQRQRELKIDSEFVRVEGLGHLLSFMDAGARANVLRFMKSHLSPAAD